MQKRIDLWNGTELPRSDQLPEIPGSRFHLIKAYEPENDGYHWLKGVAMAKVGDTWMASFGHNTCTSGENNATEVTNARISNDNCETWGPLISVDVAHGELATSSGVFLLREEELWAFNGAFYGKGRAGGRVHTRAYAAGAESVRKGEPEWRHRGVVAWDGFWPLQEPLAMENGRYVVGGVSVGGGDGGNTIPAVGLVDARDPTLWEVVRLPFAEDIWGESCVIVDGAEVLLIARSNKSRLRALAAESSDYGRTWSELRDTNLPMIDSKPDSGTLSTGRRYLINTICSDVGEAGRNPLTIVLSEKGEWRFAKAFRVIDSRQPLPGAEETFATSSLSA